MTIVTGGRFFANPVFVDKVSSVPLRKGYDFKGA